MTKVPTNKHKYTLYTKRIIGKPYDMQQIA